MNMRYHKSFTYLLPSLLLIAVIAMRFSAAQPFEQITLNFFDFCLHLKPRVYQNTPVAIVDIDEESLKRLGQWPWPRTQIADMIRRMTDAGAAVIALDIFFPEEDRTSPKKILPLWPDTAEIAALKLKAGDLPDHDRILAESFASSHVVSSFFLEEEENDGNPLLKTGFAYAGKNPAPYLPTFRGAIANLPELEQASSGNGSINFLADRDSTIRRVPVIFKLKNKIYPAFVTEALRVAQGASSLVVKSAGSSGEINFGADTGMVSIKVGNLVIPTDDQGRMWLYDSGHQPKRFIPAWKIFTGDFDPHLIKGKIIFVGTSAAGLKDLRATPLNPVSSGVEIHAQLAEQVLLENYLNRPDWAAGAEMLFLLIISFILFLLLPRLGALGSALVGAGAIAAAFGFSWYSFSVKHLLFDPVVPSVAALLFYMIISLMNFMRAESERHQVRSAFSRYLSPALVEQLAARPDQLKLGGETKTMTILFADIRGFTTISEKYNAQELTQFMNRFLTPMTEIILKNNGTIDKYIGDCIMAFWNAPLDDPDHASNACAAALEMRDHLIVWNKAMSAEAPSVFRPVRVGIGINTGNCCVGNIGSDQRFDYSVLGDDVNLASRLEGLSNVYGVDIVIGEKTFEAVKDWSVLEIDLIQAKGKTKPTRLYGLLGNKGKAAAPDYQMLSRHHTEFLAAYRTQKWDEAKKKMAECRKTELGSGELKTLYELYSERIRLHLSNPPGPDWSGAAVAFSK